MLTKRSSIIAIVVMCLSFMANAQVSRIDMPVHRLAEEKVTTLTTYHFSPIPAIGVGPNGLATKKIDVNPYCCPSTAINITAKQPVGEGDFQWVLIPLSLPQGTIKNVRVCYSIGGEGEAYISQTRLTSMTTPDRALVVLDNGTNRHSAKPTCYNVETGARINGTMTLSLKVVLSPGAEIRIGGVAIDVEQ